MIKAHCLKSRVADPDPVFLGGRILIRVGSWWSDPDPGQLHPDPSFWLAYPDCKLVILTFISKEKKYEVEIRSDPDPGFFIKVGSGFGSGSTPPVSAPLVYVMLKYEISLIRNILNHNWNWIILISCIIIFINL